MITSRVPFFRLDAKAEEFDNIRRVLESGWLTTGEWTLRFEREFASAVGAKHALAVNSCTAALHLALDAIGIKPGDRVAVPSLTFAATAEVVRYVGAIPVLIDSDPSTGCMDPGKLEAASRLGPLAAAMPVHFAGHAADMNALSEVCGRTGTALVEDAAHAFPTRCGGRPVGSISPATCFSFYANKTITVGEGGMVTTNDDLLAARMRVMRLHGIDRDAWDRYRSAKPSWEYDVVAAGYKYNLSDLASAVGVAQLARGDSMHSRRVQIAARYLDALRGLRAIILPAAPPELSDHAWHLFVIRIRSGTGADRARVIDALSGLGVATSVHYKPLHRMTYYARLTGQSAQDLPVADHWGDAALSIPLFSAMTDAEVDQVIAAVRTVFT